MLSESTTAAQKKKKKKYIFGSFCIVDYKQHVKKAGSIPLKRGNYKFST